MEIVAILLVETIELLTVFSESAAENRSALIFPSLNFLRHLIIVHIE